MATPDVSSIAGLALLGGLAGAAALYAGLLRRRAERRPTERRLEELRSLVSTLSASAGVGRTARQR